VTCFSSSIENLADFIGGTSNDGASTTDDYRPLHENGMLQQQIDNSLTGNIIRCIKAQFLEIFVLAYQLFGFIGKQIEKSVQIVTAEWLLQIFNNVELDVLVTQDVQRASGLTSTLIVIDGQFFHGIPPFIQENVMPYGQPYPWNVADITRLFHPSNRASPFPAGPPIHCKLRVKYGSQALSTERFWQHHEAQKKIKDVVRHTRLASHR
jgi:hypothetical protein